MSRIKQFFYRAVAFLFPVILFIAVMFLCKIHPFGDHTLLLWDADGQYMGILAFMRRVLLGQTDALYSLSTALGSSTAGVIAYYAASPLNWLLTLFPADRMIDAFQCLVLLKLGLAGLTCHYALSQRKETGAAVLLFSTAYALMGYTACYFWNIMWLDALVLLPLIAEGIRKLQVTKSPFLYLFSLALALFSQYYIGFMLCIFSVLWFFFLYAQRKTAGQKTQLFREGIRFAIASLLAGALAAIMLLPVYFSLPLDSVGLPDNLLTPRFSMIQLATKLFTGATDFSQVQRGLPNIYVGIPMLVLFASYICNRAIPRPQRIISAALVCVFLLSFQINGVYLLWHGLDSPNGMHTRFSFLFSFLIIWLAYDSFCHFRLQDQPLLSSRMGYCALIAVIAACILFRDGIPAYLTYETVVFDLLCFALSCGLLIWLFSSKRRTALVLLFVIQSAGLILNGYFSIHRMDYVDTLRVDAHEEFFRSLSQPIEAIKEQDDSVYRMETNAWRMENDPMLLNYPGVSHYSSSFNSSFGTTLRKLGLHQTHMRVMYGGGNTPVLESLLGIKYIIHNRDRSLAEPWRGYTELWTTKSGLRVMKNPYALPLAIIVPQSTQSSAFSADNPFVNQNQWLADLTGIIEPVFETIEVRFSKDGDYSVAEFEQPANALVYLYTDGSWFSLDDGPFEGMERYSGCVALPAQETSVQRRLTIYSGTNQTFVAVFKPDVFERAMKNISKFRCLVESDTDSHFIIHTPESAEATQLMLTLPADAGWQVQLDEKAYSVSPCYDVFLGVELPAGAHTVELTFVPNGLHLGMIISIAALLITVVWLTARRVKKQRSIQ